MHKIVPNLTAMASIVALVPAVARAEADQRPIASACASFNVGGCLAEASCSFAVQRCKEQARECRARTTTTATTPTPNPSAPAKAAAPALALPPGGEWIQNEYWPEACYVVDHQIVQCEGDARRAALGISSPWSPGRAASPSAKPAPPAPARSTPDCTRLVNENHPDCQP